MGDSDPKTLVNTLVFLFGKYFALRSGEEHRSLSLAQLEVVKGDETECSRLRYSSFGDKNFGGGLQHRRIKPKIVEQHENISNPERCIVRLYNKYITKCLKNMPQSNCFYLSPKRHCRVDEDVWFTKSPIGKNSLRKVVSDMCKTANIEGYFTNHSLRATTCSIALAKGVPEKLVMERTGHRNVLSLHTYQRESAKEREAFSDVLQGVKESFLVPEPPKKNVCEASGELKRSTSVIVISRSI